MDPFSWLGWPLGSTITIDSVTDSAQRPDLSTMSSRRPALWVLGMLVLLCVTIGLTLSHAERQAVERFDAMAADWRKKGPGISTTLIFAASEEAGPRRKYTYEPVRSSDPSNPHGLSTSRGVLGLSSSREREWLILGHGASFRLSLTMTRKFLGTEYGVTVGAEAHRLGAEFRTVLSEVFGDAGVEVAFMAPRHLSPARERAAGVH